MPTEQYQITQMILRGAKTYKGLELPKGQTSGTYTQQKMYASMKAEEFLNNLK